MTGPRLVVFDWDGTLMDSEAHIVGSMEAAMADLDLEPPPRERIRSIIGLGLAEALQELFPERPDPAFRAALVERYRARFFAADAPGALFPGARETLGILREAGHVLAVATGKSRRGLDLALAQTGLGECFAVTRCADETRSKPHPQMLEEILAATGSTPAEAVMVGDTEFDLAMARAAGVAGIAATYGVHPPDRLLPQAPVALIAAIRELPEALAAWPGGEGRDGGVPIAGSGAGLRG